MEWIVAIFGSGLAFHLGTAVVVAAVVATRWRRVATCFAVLGAAFIAASATPFSVAVEVAGAAILAVWWLAEQFDRGGPCRRSLRIILVVTALAASLVEWTAVPAFRLAPLGQPTLIVYGDSITAGMNQTHITTWPRLLSTAKGITVIDRSYAGATTAGVVRKLDRIEPGVVLLEIGGNDLLGDTPAHEFGAALDQLLTAVSGPGRTVVMFELPSVPGKSEYGRQQRRLARQHGANLIPKRVLAGVLSADGATQDGVHLTAAGQQRMADAVWQAVGAAFSEPSRTQ